MYQTSLLPGSAEVTSLVAEISVIVLNHSFKLQHDVHVVN